MYHHKYTNLNNSYFLDWGVDTRLLNLNNKSKKPVLIVDYDKRYDHADPSEILKACKIIKRQKDVKIILLQKESPIADECITKHLPFTDIYKKYNESWIYITRICSSYEIPPFY